MHCKQFSRPIAVLLSLAILMGAPLSALADVLVFGGTRGVGLETVRALRAQGEAVTVLVRETSDLTALEDIDGVSTTVGDAMDAESVAGAFAAGEFDTVVSTLGGNAEAGFAVDSVGSINAIDGAVTAGADRFILVSSIGAGDSRASVPAPMLKVLGAALAEKEKAERHLIDSGLTWTIIRPGALLNRPANGRGVLTYDANASGTISRAELARLIVEAINDDAAHSRIYSAVEQKASE